MLFFRYSAKNNEAFHVPMLILNPLIGYHHRCSHRLAGTHYARNSPWAGMAKTAKG